MKSHEHEYIRLMNENKILKKMVKAQDYLLTRYRTGNTMKPVPEWVFNAIDRGREYYEQNIHRR